MDNFVLDMSTTRNIGVEMEYSFAYNRQRTAVVDKAMALLEAGKPFMVKHKSSASVFVPDQLMSFFSGGETADAYKAWSSLNERHFQKYDSLKSLGVQVAMLLYSIKSEDAIIPLNKFNKLLYSLKIKQ